jgi:hypothetical protein
MSRPTSSGVQLQCLYSGCRKWFRVTPSEHKKCCSVSCAQLYFHETSHPGKLEVIVQTGIFRHYVKRVIDEIYTTTGQQISFKKTYPIVLDRIVREVIRRGGGYVFSVPDNWRIQIRRQVKEINQ